MIECLIVSCSQKRDLHCLYAYCSQLSYSTGQWIITGYHRWPMVAGNHKHVRRFMIPETSRSLFPLLEFQSFSSVHQVFDRATTISHVLCDVICGIVLWASVPCILALNSFHAFCQTFQIAPNDQVVGLLSRLKE